MLETDDAVENASSAIGIRPRPDYRVLLFAALLPFLGLAVWRAFHGTGLSADDFGQYLMHAQALAEGRPYGDIDYIYSKYARWIGPKLALPGLPVTLAPFLMVFGAEPVILKMAMLVFALTFVFVAALYFARNDDWRLGVGVGLLVGLSPDLVHSASQILTDLPFAALIWAVIYLTDARGEFSWKRVAAVTALGAYAVMFRTTGIVLVPAFVLFTALHYRTHGYRPVVPVFIWGAAFLFLRFGANAAQAALIRVHPEKIYEWIFVAHLPIRNSQAYAARLTSSFTDPFPWASANSVFHAFAAVLLVIGLVAWLPKAYKRFVVILAALYVLLLLILPLSQGRYLWPLYPLCIFGMLNGIKTIMLWRTRQPRLAGAAVLVFALVLTPLAAAAVIRKPKPVDLIDQPEVVQLVSFLKQRAEVEDVRVTFFKPRTLAWHTGIPAMGPINGPTRCLLEELARKRISHVIIGNYAPPRRAVADLRRLVEARPDIFQPEFKNGRFTAYRYRSGTFGSELTTGC